MFVFFLVTHGVLRILKKKKEVDEALSSPVSLKNKI